MERSVSKARLKGSKGFDENIIDFHYNPSEIILSHNAEGYADSTSKGENEGRDIFNSLVTRGSTRLILSSLIFTGTTCQSKVETLIDWVTPMRAGANQKSRREQLTFEWGAKGAGFHYTVELMRFDCTYTRFTRTGNPIRVEIRNLTLHVLPSDRKQDRRAIGSHRAPESGAQWVKGEYVSRPAPGKGGPNADPVRDSLKMGRRL
ncbi:CIS tube protein [Streptomyces cinereoruber]|uniref:CIS tube protein n=1 Tax=Streptomyces cinereoruber TaxID=67260 RepID=UPI00365C07EC